MPWGNHMAMFTLTPQIKYKFAVLMLCMTLLLPSPPPFFFFLTFGLCSFVCVSSGNSPSFLACHPEILEPTAPGTPAFATSEIMVWCGILALASPDSFALPLLSASHAATPWMARLGS